MSRHQEALNRLHYFNYFGNDGTDSFHHTQHDEDIETLQELVGKGTPIKPKNVDWNEANYTYVGECECGRAITLDEDNKYCCKCGKPIGWNNDGTT